MKTPLQILTRSCKQAIISTHTLFALLLAIIDINMFVIAFMSAEDMAMAKGQKWWRGGKEKSRRGWAFGGHELGHCTQRTMGCSVRAEWKVEFQTATTHTLAIPPQSCVARPTHPASLSPHAVWSL